MSNSPDPSIPPKKESAAPSAPGSGSSGEEHSERATPDWNPQELMLLRLCKMWLSFDESTRLRLLSELRVLGFNLQRERERQAQEGGKQWDGN